MACNSGTCQSGCYKVEEERLSPLPTETDELSNRVSGVILCIKCKVNEPMAAAATTTEFSTGDDGRRFCAGCFRTNLYGKFRFAVTSNALISPSDNVLVAFSGGPSSRVALQFVHEMQQKAQKNFDASKDKSLPVLGVGVTFVDESATFVLPSDEFHKEIEEMKLIISNLAPPIEYFHVVPIESVYSSNSIAGRDRLKELLSAVSDITGRADLVEHLRLLSLQKVALENGVSKIVLGTCTSRIACHVLESTVKGKGYSLAADIQYVDARWEIPFVLPLRDCLLSELNILCTLDRLKTIGASKLQRTGINGLVSSFVKLLQEENPSRESTIVRTAGKLTPFHFNTMPELNDGSCQLASHRRKKKYNLRTNEYLPPESFCPICNSPLKKSQSKTFSNLEDGKIHREFINACCGSCHFQILPKELSALENFRSLLPDPIVAQVNHCGTNTESWLREQIQDCLLSDTED